MTMIDPTNGRVVLVKSALVGTLNTEQARPAMVSYVHSPRLINVGGFNADGTPFAMTSLTLLQDDDAPPEHGFYAEWMPFQKGQAAKTEALEKQVAASEPEVGKLAAGPKS